MTGAWCDWGLFQGARAFGEAASEVSQQQLERELQTLAQNVAVKEELIQELVHSEREWASTKAFAWRAQDNTRTALAAAVEHLLVRGGAVVLSMSEVLRIAGCVASSYLVGVARVLAYSSAPQGARTRETQCACRMLTSSSCDCWGPRIKVSFVDVVEPLQP